MSYGKINRVSLPFAFPITCFDNTVKEIGIEAKYFIVVGFWQSLLVSVDRRVGARKTEIIHPIWEATVENGGYWGIKFSSNYFLMMTKLQN